MKKLKITFDEMTQDIIGKKTKFPKYVSPIINLANRWARGTVPEAVGQMTEIAKNFKNYEEWKDWYYKNYPNTIDKATEKIYKKLLQVVDVISQVDKEDVRKWVEDLVITKSFVGINFQESILKRIAEIKETTYRLATPSEESKGIDGYIGEIPISIKPTTYKLEEMLPETIPVKIIYYKKIEKDGIYVYYDL